MLGSQLHRFTFQTTAVVLSDSCKAGSGAEAGLVMRSEWPATWIISFECALL
jgi:hypothetical protein